jgi:hypothetical protein
VAAIFLLTKTVVVAGRCEGWRARVWNPAVWCAKAHRTQSRASQGAQRGIGWASDSASPPVHDRGGSNRYSNIFVTEEFLHGSDIVAALDQRSDELPPFQWDCPYCPSSPRGRKVTDDLLRQIQETVKRFSWLFVAKQVTGVAFRGKAWRRPVIHHGRAARAGENGEIASLHSQ